MTTNKENKLNENEIDFINILWFIDFNWENFSVKKINNWNTILMEVAMKIYLKELSWEDNSNYLKIFKKLVRENQININDQNKEDSTLLSNLIILWQTELVKILISSRTDLDKNIKSVYWNTYLDMARAFENNEIINILENYYENQINLLNKNEENDSKKINKKKDNTNDKNLSDKLVEDNKNVEEKSNDFFSTLLGILFIIIIFIIAVLVIKFIIFTIYDFWIFLYNTIRSYT